MPFLRITFPQVPPAVIRYIWDFLTRVIARRVLPWARSVFVEAGVGVLQLAHTFAIDRTAEYVISLFFFFWCC